MLYAWHGSRILCLPEAGHMSEAPWARLEYCDGAHILS